MAEFLYSNNAASILASGISDVATSLDVSPGTGAIFPNPGAGQQFNVTLIDAITGDYEIVKVTGRSTDTFTIVRAQESTAARAFVLGDKVELRVTAEGLNGMVQESATQTLTNKTIDANATGNNIVNVGVDEWLTSVSGTDTITASANASITAYAAGQVFSFKAAGANTSAVTIDINSLGAKSIKKSGTDDLAANDIPAANAMVTIVYDGTNFQLATASGGSSAGGAVWENSQTISENYTMTTGKNGHSVGPITVDSGVSVTVPSGSRWVIS